jgi:hypothetical protein
MRHPTRRKAGVLSVFALLASAFAAILASATPAGAQTEQSQACVVPLTGDAFQLPIFLDGDAPGTVEPGSSFNLDNVNLQTVLAGAIMDAGIELGFIAPGDILDVDIALTTAGTNVAEGPQTLNESIQVEVIVDAEGNAVDQPVDLNMGSQTWTADGVDGDIIDFRQFTADLFTGEASLHLAVDIGVLVVNILCSPGTVDDTVLEPTIDDVTLIDPAATFASTEIGSVPPTAVDDSASVAQLDCVVINVLANDIAGTNPIDPATVTVVTAPTAGTATPAPDGTVTYCNDDDTAEADSFTYNVADTELNVSNDALVTIAILGDFCDATTDPCDLEQVIQVQVVGDTLTLQQAGSLVTLESITLDGQPQTTGGELNGLTIVNARGTDAGWDVTGVMSSDFHDGVGSPNCPIDDPSSWHNHCIPGGNLGWSPGAEVAHEQIPGDVAHVDAGSGIAPHSPGLGEAQLLCSAPANQSGGTFTCGGGVSLAIPASAAAGVYQGTLTLTLA